MCAACGKPAGLGTRARFWESYCRCIEHDIDVASKTVIKVVEATVAGGIAGGIATGNATGNAIGAGTTSSSETADQADSYRDRPGSEVDSDDQHREDELSDVDIAEVEASLDGKYEFISVLGRGGMGAVYKVRHRELGKTFAAKILNPDLVKDKQARRRFHQEAEAESKLTHPNLVAVYEHAVGSGGAPYLVMDYLDGTELATVLDKNGSLTEARALPIFAQIAEALAHAHNKGVVHRDVKPENIILNQEGKLDVVKLVDFGIAKVLTNERATQRLTQTGEIFGSPLYMSPEQCLGNQQDARSDIYAMGCVMYEVLTGQPPLAGDNPIATILKHVNDAPVPLASKVAPNTISASLQAIIMRCLEKQPSDRYQTAQELLNDINKVSNGGTVKFYKPRRRRTAPAPMALAALSIALCCVFVVGWTVAHQRGQTQIKDASPAATTQTAEELMTMAEMYQHSDHEDLPKAEKYLKQAVNLGSSEACVRLGNLYAWNFFYKVPNKYEKAVESFRQAAAKGNPQGFERLGNMYEEGEGVQQDYHKALQCYQSAAAKGDVSALRDLGNLYENGFGVPQDFQKAADFYRKGVAAKDFQSEAKLANLYQYGLGVPQDYAKAFQHYKEAANVDKYLSIRVGDFYRDGLGVKKDIAEAKDWYHRADFQGEFALGQLSEKGIGTPKDNEVAAQHYREGSKYGDYRCAYNLAELIMGGKVNAPAAEAKEALHRAVDGAKFDALRGDAAAQYLYAEILSKGYLEDGTQGTPDLKQARVWYENSARKNYHGAAAKAKS